MNNKKNKIIHILVILFGLIFISLGAIHKNLWFDETYSVALANHSFSDIWRIGGTDVHPVLYYMLLKIVNIIFGSNVLAYRLFSVLGIAILGILGYTHIRKDFGEKTGILFSFFTFFLPTMAIYASEIRMYAWSAVFVTLTAIYAYRITKQNKLKNWILFGVFSLASLYMHYYGVMGAGLINVALFIYIIRRKECRKANIIKFLIIGFIQLLSYIPWIYCLIAQIAFVSEGFWISVTFPDIIFEVMQFQCLGNVDERIAIVLSFSLLVVSFYYLNKNNSEKIKIKEELKNFFDNKKEINPGKQAIIIYFAVIIAAGIISLKTPILYPRYLFVITGLLIFFLSYALSKCDNKKMLYTICIFTLIVSIYSNILFINTNYKNTNMVQIEYLSQNIQKDDIIIFKNSELGSGSVINVNFPEYTTYFYDIYDWKLEKPYEAYAPGMEIIHNLDMLENYTGRIWLLDSEDYSLYNEIAKQHHVEVIEQKDFYTEYKEYVYKFILINKI